MAEMELNKEVKKAVITVPAYFNNSQRESTKIACELAGLEVLRIINEPTAAVLAYGLNEINVNQNKKILVFDLGGRTLDVTILSLESDVFEVLSTDGDINLGGFNFDQILYDLARQKFADENDNKDLNKNLRAKLRVKKACEKAKLILSENDQTTIKLEKLYLACDLEVIFTKEKFEELCKPYFDICMNKVDNTLKLAKLKENDIGYLILIGGSTRIPYIKNMLKNKFKNSKLCFSINPDEAVSIGAAIQGANITRKNNINNKFNNNNSFSMSSITQNKINNKEYRCPKCSIIPFFNIFLNENKLFMSSKCTNNHNYSKPFDEMQSMLKTNPISNSICDLCGNNKQLSNIFYYCSNCYKFF